jgi:hypothetical protein
MPPIFSSPLSPSPISPFVAAPFSDGKLPKLFASLGWRSGGFQSRSTTQSRKSLDPTSAPAIAFLSAQREVAEVRWVRFAIVALKSYSDTIVKE